MKGNSMIRRQIIFYGRVQGVGFRYKARYMADSLGLTGYVHNEYDGSVKMEVQVPMLRVSRQRLFLMKLQTNGY